jgi:hypothetical protein
MTKLNTTIEQVEQRRVVAKMATTWLNASPKTRPRKPESQSAQSERLVAGKKRKIARCNLSQRRPQRKLANTQAQSRVGFIVEKKLKIRKEDHEALARALVMERKSDPQRAVRIDERIAATDWRQAAEAAAHSCQARALRLKPWQATWTPCRVEPDDRDSPGYEHRGITKAAALLRRLLDSGCSRFEPDPLGALERVEVEPAPVFKKEAPAKSEGSKVADDPRVH